MKVSEIVQLLMAGGIIIGVSAACYYQNWALVGTIITGAFALLNGNRSTTVEPITKGDLNVTKTVSPLGNLDTTGL